ncbi:conserved hypothetical protein [Acidimicrobium ferrooxidans DSM 10331]|uniref:Bacterial proteasome activator n=1 Tax=Acidimicrobium ferrooxidans (strain DSM 10331 / JCM 15462 / NBRC 103882 / ICP) TaxID=525909 RepID=C7LZH1_ACIFD|nr:proteasome activator [Acidimicrobium ferrooxidans]ACU54129.1 conserved hypothetical protein [Acidimicrobium ferrooxidans DSM 10331]
MAENSEYAEQTTAGASGEPNAGSADTDAVMSPARVIRIGAMVRALLDEVRQATLDERSRERLAEIYEQSLRALSEVVSPDLADELRSFSLPFQEGVVPSEAELRVAQAQLLGWLEGLFQGIQATLFAQRMASNAQLEQLRGRGLPQPPGAQQAPGAYL